MQITLTTNEKEMIVIGLNMRKNYIETGNVLISAADAERFKKDTHPKSLSIPQMQLIIDMENLINKLYDTR